ncbi:MAG: HAMP domain-containing protein, partial [Candidatus Aegiribacteria sp.]|nr:HAMP domain-containing protein [Candidatus Aegiribacteria sp.]MBD3294752.1 HAMP domain-containing protein [Candidatus Fermentibacteria bacterium]
MKKTDRSFPGISLRRLVVLPVLILAALATLIAGFLTLRSGEIALNNVSQALRREISQKIQIKLNQYLSDPETVCNTTADMMSSGLLDPGDIEEMHSFLLTQIKSYPNITSVYFGNPEGGLVDIGREIPDNTLYQIRTEDYAAGTFIKHNLDENYEPHGSPVSVIPNFDARTRSWYTGGLSNPEELHRSDPYQVFTQDAISISTSRAIFSDQGEFLGVISCDVFLSDLSNFLSNMDIGISGFALITDPSGWIIAGSIDSLSFSDNGPLNIEETGDPVLSIIGEEVASRAGGFSGIREPLEFSLENAPEKANCTVTPFTDSSGSTYYITVLIPDSDFRVYSGNFYLRTMILLAGTFIVVVLLSLLISYLITRPILRLHGTATKLSEGEEAVFPVSRINELNDLSMVLADLTSTLQETNRELTEEMEERKAAEVKQAQLQEEINKTRRLDSVGKLAGGVAHDLNNLLTPIIGYAEILYDADVNDEHKSYLKEILRAGDSARALVSQLLAFGRKQYLELATVDLNKLIAERKELIRTALKD